MKPYRELSAEQKKRRIARAIAWNRDNRERSRKTQSRARWRAAGMNPTHVEAALAAHNGKCDCCGTDSPGGRFAWNVDHDHSTGKMRGVLCHNCNTAIGKLGDTLEGVLRAVRYLNPGPQKEISQ